jgi:glycosyltransferase involved in cell wall biosynthesis
MYWHATGLGENEVDHPERFEHFGITTVEAMAAGSVPLVLRAGGLPEIVRSSVDGVLWDSLDDLRRETVALSKDVARWKELSEGARRRAADFDGVAFDHRLTEVLRQLEAADGRD